MRAFIISPSDEPAMRGGNTRPDADYEGGCMFCGHPTEGGDVCCGECTEELLQSGQCDGL